MSKVDEIIEQARKHLKRASELSYEMAEESGVSFMGESKVSFICTNETLEVLLPLLQQLEEYRWAKATREIRVENEEPDTYSRYYFDGDGPHRVKNIRVNGERPPEDD